VIWGVLHLSLTFPRQMNAGAHWLPTILQIIGLSVVLTWLYVRVPRRAESLRLLE